MTETGPEFLDVGRGGAARRIAVQVRDGSGPPVVWLGGFRSDMTATKATALDAWAAATGRSWSVSTMPATAPRAGPSRTARSRHGLRTRRPCWPPTSMRLPSWSAPRWAAGSPASPPARGPRGVAETAGLVLIAPALDFTEDLIWDRLSDAARAMMLRDGVLKKPSAYAPEPDPITLALIEDGRRNRMLDGMLELGCPVHVLQGMRDRDVPHTHALKILGHLPAEGTVLTLIADGDHRLSRPQDIARLVAAVAEIA